MDRDSARRLLKAGGILLCKGAGGYPYDQPKSGVDMTSGGRVPGCRGENSGKERMVNFRTQTSRGSCLTFNTSSCAKCSQPVRNALSKYPCSLCECLQDVGSNIVPWTKGGVYEHAHRAPSLDESGLLRYTEGSSLSAVKICPCCGKQFPLDKFIGEKCPVCMSKLRGRLTCHHLRNLVCTKRNDATHPLRIAHFAVTQGENTIQHSLKCLDEVQYLSMDLSWYISNVDLRADIMDIPVKSNTIDLFIAHQVLEHVDDQRALAEISRVMDDGAVAILSIPITARSKVQPEFGYGPHNPRHPKQYIVDPSNPHHVRVYGDCDSTAERFKQLGNFSDVIYDIGRDFGTIPEYDRLLSGNGWIEDPGSPSGRRLHIKDPIFLAMK